MAPIRRFFLRFVSFFRAGQAEAELAREISSHLQFLEDRFVAEGMSVEEARFAARRAFGGVEQVKEHQRDARSFRWLDEWWLDLKLGVRMLIKYPGLTAVGVLGMAVGIGIGAGSFAFFYSYLDPPLPLDEGERVVGIRIWDAAANQGEPHALHDFATWRDELDSVEDLGAFRTLRRNLIAQDGSSELVSVAEITASGFRLARVPPLLGRYLIEEDGREGAPPVAVIGHEVWRTRYGSDPAAVGRTVRLGNVVYTIVGVMPEGFAFPVNHRLWVPLRANPSEYERRQGPAIDVFGRLAPGVTMESAQAELTTIGQRTAAAFPKTHEHLRPRVVPYTALWFDELSRWEVRILQFFLILLLVVVCVNVAILIYARTATRQAEIAVRTALGASRGRIVAQLFIEALVLSTTAAVVGLVLARLALGQVSAVLERELGGAPFWSSYGLTYETVLYAMGLAVLAAVIAGVVPALKATGRWMQTGLRELGGSTSLHLGRTWNMLIVAQVAFSVALLPPTVSVAWQSVRHGTAEPGFAAEELLTALIGMDREVPPTAEAEAYRREVAARFANHQTELARRLEAEPGVTGATFAMALPGDELTVWIEIEGVTPPKTRSTKVSASGFAAREGTTVGQEVRFNRVAEDFFDVFDVPILTGRRFHSGDLEAGASFVIVNRTLVEQFLGGGNAVGRRLRYVGRGGDARPEHVELGRWYEIVGVVGNLPLNPIEPGLSEAKLYHPAAPGEILPVHLALRVRGAAPETLAGRLREITMVLDGTLRLHEILPLDEVYGQERMGLYMGALALALVTLSAVLLSTAGIYALMSFTVSQRRREIGIRTALGADPQRILWSIFSRAVGQLAIGVAVGLGAAALLEKLSDGELMRGNGAVLLPLISVLMMAVGLLAAVEPAQRGLRVQPTEALREQ
jgi:putative ABC transport system permease protein